MKKSRKGQKNLGSSFPRDLPLEVFLAGPGSGVLYAWLGYGGGEIPLAVLFRGREWELADDDRRAVPLVTRWLSWVFKPKAEAAPAVLEHLLPSSWIQVRGTSSDPLWVCRRQKDLAAVLQPRHFLVSSWFLPPSLQVPGVSFRSQIQFFTDKPAPGPRLWASTVADPLLWVLSPLTSRDKGPKASWLKDFTKVLGLYWRSQDDQTGLGFQGWKALEAPAAPPGSVVSLVWRLYSGAEAFQAVAELSEDLLGRLLLHQGFPLEGYKRRYGNPDAVSRLHLLNLVLMTRYPRSLETAAQPGGRGAEWGEFLSCLPQEDFQALQASLMGFRRPLSHKGEDLDFQGRRWELSAPRGARGARGGPVSASGEGWFYALALREASSSPLLSSRGRRIFRRYFLDEVEKVAVEGLRQCREKGTALGALYELPPPQIEDVLRTSPDRQVAMVLLSAQDKRWRRYVSAAHESRLGEEMAFVEAEVARGRVTPTQLWTAHLDLWSHIQKKT